MKKTVITFLCAATAVATMAGCTTNLNGGNEPSKAPANNESRIEVPTEDPALGSSDVQLETDNYYESGKAWLEMEDSKMDLVIGPNETADDQLLGWASIYYEFAKGEQAPNIEIDHVDGDTVYIIAFSKDDSDPEKKTTLEMYAIDRKTGEGKNLAGEAVDLTTFYKRTTGAGGVE